MRNGNVFLEQERFFLQQECFQGNIPIQVRILPHEFKDDTYMRSFGIILPNYKLKKIGGSYDHHKL